MYDLHSFVIIADYVVTIDGIGSVFSPGYVEIEQDRIKSVGPVQKTPDCSPKIEYGNAVIMPGLINSHNHMGMSLMRGVADDLPLDEWLEKHIWPLESEFVSPEYIRTGTLLSAVEMLKSGTTFSTDMYFFEDDVAAACRQAGIRCMIGEGAIAFPTPSVKDPDSIFDVIRDQVERYASDDLISVHVAAHSTYATTGEQLQKCAEIARELNLPVQIHCAESRKEAEDCLAKHGKSQIQLLNDIGLLDVGIGLVHMVWPQSSDWKLLKRNNISIISCLQSNLKLASGIPPIARYADENIRIALGTDGAASNNNLDIWEEIRLAALIAKGQSLDATRMPAQEALRMVTIDAAKAWGFENELGSLEKGKKADITVLDLNMPNTTPCYDIFSTIVYSAGASNVKDVFVGGEQVVKDGNLTTVDEEDIVDKVLYWRRKIKGC